MARKLDFVKTPLKGLYRIDRKPVEDHRGFFNRLFCADELKEVGFNKSIVQINHTLTRKKGTVRGLHYQNFPHSETKIVTCLQGEVFDVAVDLRRGSTTFLKWHSEVLSSKNQSSLFIPDGFAHGFQALSEDCILLYMHSATFSPENERSLNVIDPKLSITWPLRITDISERDRNHPMLSTAYQGVKLYEM